ncbi:MAG TPA: flavoprotein, partial [Syntrophales bacterium]|nr:flavoprotein [Syntrophales bacterium]
MRKKIIIGISGASGAIYAVKLIETLLAKEVHVHLIISEIGAKVFAHELAIEGKDVSEFFSRMHDRGNFRGEVTMHDSTDMFTPVASG